MKKYIALTFLFLLIAIPVSAKAAIRQPNQVTAAAQVSPTGYQVQNRNQIQTQNQGEATQVAVQNQEKEQLESKINENMGQVATQVQELIDTVGAKGGIGVQVREIAQEQQKNQEQIKEQYTKLSTQSKFAKLMIGADQEAITALQAKLMENEQLMLKLENLKLQSRVQADLQKIEETIALMKDQNANIRTQVQLEQKYKGVFGWLLQLFK